MWRRNSGMSDSLRPITSFALVFWSFDVEIRVFSWAVKLASFRLFAVIEAASSHPGSLSGGPCLHVAQGDAGVGLGTGILEKAD